MSNSKPPNKIKSFLSLMAKLLAIAQYIPFIGKYKPLLAAVSAVLATLGGVTMCNGESPEIPPVKQAEPIPEPTASPSPTPQPTPTRPPLPELKAPGSVKVGESFRVELCHVGNLYDVSLFAEKWRLGFLGFGDPCMFLHVSLNTAGKRNLIAIGKDLRVETNVVVQ
jgi:hypothetical protein